MVTSETQHARLKTLIVEDNSIVRRGLRALIESTPGLELIAEVDDVPEALAVVFEHEPDLMVLDLSLPSGSGLDVIHHIRKFGHRCRVIVFSGTITEREAQACLLAGAHYCFNKVLDYERLQATLLAWGKECMDPSSQSDGDAAEGSDSQLPGLD